MAHKDVHALIPGTCKYVTLHDKRNSANVIKLPILKLGDYCRLSRRAHGSLHVKEKSRKVRVGTAGFEGG